jgi:hypothetical protein
MAETKRSSTGGTVTYPSPGVLRHVSGGNYSGKTAAQEAKKK